MRFLLFSPSLSLPRCLSLSLAVSVSLSRCVSSCRSFSRSRCRFVLCCHLLLLLLLVFFRSLFCLTCRAIIQSFSHCIRCYRTQNRRSLSFSFISILNSSFSECPACFAFNYCSAFVCDGFLSRSVFSPLLTRASCLRAPLCSCNRCTQSHTLTHIRAYTRNPTLSESFSWHYGIWVCIFRHTTTVTIHRCVQNSFILFFFDGLLSIDIIKCQIPKEKYSSAEKE